MYIQCGCWNGGSKAEAGPRGTYSEGVERVGQRLSLDPDVLVHTVRMLKG